MEVWGYTQAPAALHHGIQRPIPFKSDVGWAPVQNGCIRKEKKFTHTFIHSVFWLTTGPKLPPKRFLYIVRSRTSFFKWEYPLLSLRSSSSFLRLLPRLLVTSIPPPFIFPSITCFRRQFLRKMWPNQLAFRFLISRSNIAKQFRAWVSMKGYVNISF